MQARENDSADWTDAAVGEVLYPGGSAQSGAESRARLDLAPEGTIIRLAPNSLFFIEELGTRNDAPYTRLKLLMGELRIILFGGELETDTSVGTATVRGSMMSVRFDPDSESMVVTCLEGHCGLENDKGSVSLQEGETSEISSKDAPPSAPEPLNEEDQREWEESSPEAASWLMGTPVAPTPLAAPIPTENPEAQEKGNGGTLSYDLYNNCPDRMWHWTFEGPVTVSFTLQPGESASGTLPPGDYIVTDVVYGSGERHQTGPMLASGGGHLSVRSCPDK